MTNLLRTAGRLPGLFRLTTAAHARSSGRPRPDPGARLASVAGLPLPVYLTADLEPSLTPSEGTAPNRPFVCSIPKAGTYLVSELLRRLGYVATRLHVWNDGFSDYRFASIREAREQYHRYTVRLPLERSLELVRPGQFAVGHLEHTPAVVAALGGARPLFVYRDLRDAVVSHMRFFGDTGRGGAGTRDWKDLPDAPAKFLQYLDRHGEMFFGICRAMTGWATDPGACPVRFETLCGDDGPAERQALVDRVFRFLGLPGDPPDAAALLGDVLGRSTLTWSGRRTERAAFWDADVEARFAALGGPDLNAALGYR